MQKALLLAFVAVAFVGCGKVKDPTPKGSVVLAWDRSTAKAYDPNEHAGGPKHPLADAKILEGPKTRSFTVTVKGTEGKNFAVDLDVDTAKVSWAENGKEETRWATTKITAKVAANDAFHVTGKCDDQVGYVLAAPGDVTNTVVNCDITAKRPNSMGTKDAITDGAMIQFEGTGKILPVADNVEVVEH
jgi:hypothetical protein